MAPRYSRQTPEERRAALFAAAFAPDDEDGEGNDAMLEHADRMAFDPHADPAPLMFADGGEVNAAGPAADNDRVRYRESVLQRMNREAREGRQPNDEVRSLVADERALQATADRLNAEDRDKEHRRALADRGYVKNADGSVEADPKAQERTRIIRGLASIRSRSRGPASTGPVDADNRHEADMGHLRRTLRDSGVEVRAGERQATRYAEGGSVLPNVDEFLSKRDSLLRAARKSPPKPDPAAARDAAAKARETASMGRPKRDVPIPSGGTLPVYTGDSDKVRLDISPKKEDTREATRYAKGGFVAQRIAKNRLNPKVLRALRGK